MHSAAILHGLCTCVGQVHGALQPRLRLVCLTGQCCTASDMCLMEARMHRTPSGIISASPAAQLVVIFATALGCSAPRAECESGCSRLPAARRYPPRVNDHWHGSQPLRAAYRCAWPPSQPFCGRFRTFTLHASDRSHIPLRARCARCMLAADPACSHALVAGEWPPGSTPPPPPPRSAARTGRPDDATEARRSRPAGGCHGRLPAAAVI